MTHITKGANAPVPAGPLRVAVGRGAVPGTPSVDASALLLDATGRVRGDADLVFHNQPRHPSGAVRHAGVGQGGGQFAEWLELDLPNVEPAVQRVVIAGSCDGGTFGQVPGLYVQVVTTDGTIAVHYEVTDASTETAFVLGEFYRRDGAWRFRAVGQGYDSGLAGLATDFGIEVARPPAPSVSGPVPLTGVSKGASAPADATARQVPEPAVRTPAPPVPAGPSSAGPVPGMTKSAAPEPTGPGPGPAPANAPAGAHSWGPDFFDFEPYVLSGSGNASVTVDLPFPPNSEPVILDVRLKGFEFIVVKIPGREDDLLCNEVPGLHGRVLLVPPRKGGPVQLKVRHDGDWTFTVLPLSAARPIGPGTTVGRGPEVFVHTGGPADLKIRASCRYNSWFLLTGHKGDKPDDLRNRDQLHSEWDGRKIRKTVRISDGHRLLVVDKTRGDWELTLDPLPVPDPPKVRPPAVEESVAAESRRGRETPVYAGPGPTTGVYAGRGPTLVTLVNPRPGRPALLQYDFKGVRSRLMLALLKVDEHGDEDEWLNGIHHGVRGVGMVFGTGAAETTVKVEHAGEWSLRLLPEEQAPLITGRVEGKGTTILRYPGPPTLMTVQRTSRGETEPLAADAVNHPFGKSTSIADTVGRRRPALGPVWVDPGGSCFVMVTAREETRWRLEPVPLDAATVLGARTQGGWYGVVRHTGPEADAVIASTKGDVYLYELDENLFPVRKITRSSGPYRIPGSILQVRAHGEWVIELRS